MRIQEIWTTLEKFMDSCEIRGWKTSKKNYWVETEKGYHNFLWTKHIHLSSFISITASRKCVVQKGQSYQVVDASYTAWLFAEEPSKTLLEAAYENPEITKRTAIYNLNPISKGKSQILKLNETDSPVFHEFERFLVETLEIKLKPMINPKIKYGEHKVTELV